MSNKTSETLTAFAKETMRFRSELAKGRSAMQLSLFDLLVERSADLRAPKEIEIALVLFGEQGLKDAAADSGVRVYVHRLRKRLAEFYRDKTGPQLFIPKGEYRIILEDTKTAYPRAISPVLGVGLFIIALAILLLGTWAVTPSSRETSMTGVNRQGNAVETIFGVTNPIVAVGDRLVIAETKDQRSVQRMILEPAVASREDLGRYLKAHPDAFYRLYDFNIRFAPVGSVAAAWQIQEGFGTRMTRRTPNETLFPISALTDDMLKSRDVIFVGRVSNLGPLAKPVFVKSRFRLKAYNQLVDTVTGRVYTNDAYSDTEQSLRVDYGYIAVLGSPFGRNIVVLSGLDDQATRAMAEFAVTPGNIASVRDKLKTPRRFEALFEVRSREGLPVEHRLIVSRPFP